MSDNPREHTQTNDRAEDKATEKSALNPSVAKQSQTDAVGKAEIESSRTNKHNGSAGGEGPSITIEAIDKDGKRREVSRTNKGTEKDLLSESPQKTDSSVSHGADRKDILDSGTISALAKDNPVAEAGKTMLEATKDPRVKESIKRDLTEILRTTETRGKAAQDENFVGGTLKIPQAAKAESPVVEFGRKILQAEIEFTEPQGHHNESAYPIEQAIWKVFHPQDANLTDGQINLFRTAVTESTRLFVGNAKSDLDSFIEENKTKVALTLAGAVINTGVALEASKDGATAAGGPAAAAGIITILKYIESQLKPSAGIPNASPGLSPDTQQNNPDKLIPASRSFKPANEIYEDFKKAIDRLSESPADALEELWLKADVMKAVETKVSLNPESHHVPEHVMKLVEQMESANLVDLVQTATDSEFVYPDNISSLTEYSHLPEDVRNIVSEPSGPRLAVANRAASSKLSNIDGKNYIIVPAEVQEALTGRKIGNDDVQSHLLHEMGHWLKGKYEWTTDAEVRRGLYDGQRRLEKDLQAVYEKVDNKLPLSRTEQTLARFQNYTYDMRSNTTELQRMDQREEGAEEVLCELYATDHGTGFHTAYGELLYKYFGPVVDHLRKQNWNRPKDPTGIRRFFGDR